MAVVAENPVCECNLCKPDRNLKKPVDNINCKKQIMVPIVASYLDKM